MHFHAPGGTSDNTWSYVSWPNTFPSLGILLQSNLLDYEVLIMAWLCLELCESG